ncbi:CysZ protein [Desulfoprunum benzoelyticum]|uniref:CysZ protein n=2 Tax=Desulfoprunum benzoelyticum TaxID=1506996 RepID=A0A840V1E0_9BACT|nr:CysZ protein [Desulfoprunum benzoelyticum]
MFKTKRLLGYSIVLFAVTIALTWFGYMVTTNYADTFISGYFNSPPVAEGIWGWIKHSGWVTGKWFLLVISRIFAFYLSFLFSYSLTTPGYVLLSTATEKVQLGKHFDPDDGFSLRGALIDLVEGIKIGLYGVLVAFVALLVNFIPVIGQVVVFLLYTYYSALMFIDYPASRRRWTLSRKIGWISANRVVSFRLGFVPAVLSMVPFLNIFLLALLFPILTIHATLNFTSIQPHNDGTQ